MVTVLILVALGVALTWHFRLTPPAVPCVQKPLTVEVVRLISELRGKPPFLLPEGGCIRLGISGIESYIGASQLLYCLAQGVTLPDLGELSFDVLGPVVYEVIGPVETRKESKKLYYFCPAEWCKGEVLFCALVTTPSTGEYKIRFSTPDNSPVASATITASRPDPHPWQPIAPQTQTGCYYVTYHPEDAAALPSFSGAIGVRNPNKLPRLVLGEDVSETSDLKIAVDETTLRLSFDKPVHERLDWRLLCRWWVNGRPVVPSGTFQQELGIGHDGKAGELSRIGADIRVDSDKLGAKVGDIIGLQVMYAPHGWEYTDGVATYEFFIPLATPVNPMVSNVVQFTYEQK